MQPHNARATASLVVSPSVKTFFDSSVSPLIETFYTGVGGWADRQLPDGPGFWTCLFSGLAPVPAALVPAAIEAGRSHLCFGELVGSLEEARVVEGRNHVIDVALRKP